MKTHDCYTLAPQCRRGFRFLVFPLIGAMMVIALVRIMHYRRSLETPTVSPPSLSVGANRIAEPVVDINTADALLADVYPSKQSAVRALAKRLPDAVSQISDKPSALRMTFDDRPLSGALLYDALRKQFPNATIGGAAQDAQKFPGEVTIGMRIDDDPVKPPRRAAKGNVQVTIASRDRATSLSAKFLQCDWADDLTDYINEHPGHTWIVVRLQRPGLTPSEARRAAEDAAADAILQVIQPRNPVSTAPLGPQARSTMPLRGDIRAQLPVSDRFTQQFHRPYGNVWTESILLDVSPQWLDGLQRRQANALRASEARVQTTAASMAVVLVTILLAYLFANAVTKRYFTGRLRAVAILCALIALAVTVGIISFA